MLTLRGWAMLLAVGVLLQPAAAAAPDHVTYVLGGVMSGPYRLDGDLTTGDFAQAQPPPGKRGDGAGIDARTMPVTRQWIVPPQKLAVLRRLAAAVWRHGMEDVYIGRTVVRHTKAGPVIVPPVLCQPSLDALGGLTLEQDGRKKSFDFSMSCLSKAGDRFLKALFATE